MAVTVAEIIDDNRYSLDSAIHYYHVAGLDFAGKGRSAIVDALNAPGIPAKDTPHPFLANLVAKAPEVTEILGNGQVRVAAEYVERDPLDPDAPGDPNAGDDNRTTVRLGSVFEVVTTSRDADGNPMKIPYSFEAEGGLIDAPSGTESIYKIGSANVMVPRLSLTVSKDWDSLNGPAQIFSKFATTTNSTPWVDNLAPRQGFRSIDKPRCWLLASVTTTESPLKPGGFGACRASIEFVFNPDGWDPVVALVNPDTGQPFDNVGKIPIIPNEGIVKRPEEFAVSNGIKVFRVQGSTDFKRLRLWDDQLR